MQLQPHYIAQHDCTTLITLHYTTSTITTRLHYTTLHYTYYTTLRYTTLHHNTSHITLHCTALHCTALHTTLRYTLNLHIISISLGFLARVYTYSYLASVWSGALVSFSSGVLVSSPCFGRLWWRLHVAFENHLGNLASIELLPHFLYFVLVFNHLDQTPFAPNILHVIDLAPFHMVKLKITPLAIFMWKIIVPTHLS